MIRLILEWLAFQSMGGMFILELAQHLGGKDVRVAVEYYLKRPGGPWFLLFWLAAWPAIMTAVIVATIIHWTKTSK